MRIYIYTSLYICNNSFYPFSECHLSYIHRKPAIQQVISLALWSFNDQKSSPLSSEAFTYAQRLKL